MSSSLFCQEKNRIYPPFLSHSSLFVILLKQYRPIILKIAKYIQNLNNMAIDIFSFSHYTL